MLCCLLASLALAPADVALADARVTPSTAFFGRSPVVARFTLRAPRPVNVHVEVVSERTRRVVRRIVVRSATPGPVRVTWDGVAGSGRVAPDGRYRVRAIIPSTGRRRLLGVFALYGRIYPIRGPHADRGPIGQFGVGRSGGRTHEGFDVNAACGTPLVAARAGLVVRSRYDPVLYGHEVIIRGERDGRTYRYSHLRDTPLVARGDHVRTGQRIGLIGATGNARTVGCHLHFELRSHTGRLLDPEPHLHAWDSWS